MSEMHSLTEKLIELKRELHRVGFVDTQYTREKHWNEADTIIRAWLSEKAEEFDELIRKELGLGRYSNARWSHPKIEQILGLSEHDEKKSHQDWLSGGNTMSMPTPEQGKVWCEHISTPHPNKNYFILKTIGGGSMSMWDDFMHCPICGTPKPKEQTLEERVAEAISKSFGYLAGADTCRNAADAAITTVLAYQKEMMK